MIDHVTLNVTDVDVSKAFYEEALAPLGYAVTLDYLEGCGFGAEGGSDFFLAQRGEPSAPFHIAFAAPSRTAVDAFYSAAIGAGGQDNGPPGVRRVYHDHYYGAYVLDPDG